jgi:hypothetical protein
MCLLTTPVVAQEAVRNPRQDRSTTDRTSTSTSSSISSSSSSSSSSSCTPCQSCEAAESRQAQATAAAFARAERRADTRLVAREDSRTVKLCGEQYNVPAYESWHAAGGGTNPYSHYFTFSWRNPENTCRRPDFRLTVETAATVRSTDIFATEHVYELQLLGKFHEWAAQNDPKISKRAAGDFCRNVFTPLFKSKSGWPSTVPYSSREAIYDLVGRLSGGHLPQEMVYLRDRINGKKKNWAAGNDISNYNTWQNELEELAFASAMYQYLRTDSIVDIFKAVSGRIRDFYIGLDNAVAAANAQGQKSKLGDISWTEAYDNWVRIYFDAIDDKWKRYRQEAVRNVRRGLEMSGLTSHQQLSNYIGDEAREDFMAPMGGQPGYLSDDIFTVDDRWYDSLGDLDMDDDNDSS